MNVLARIFRRPVVQHKISAADFPPDAWRQLQALGYEERSYAREDGLRRYAYFLNGKIVSTWTPPITNEESNIARRIWAEEELELIRKDK